MSSHLLAVIFAVVMVGVTFMNKTRDAVQSGSEQRSGVPAMSSAAPAPQIFRRHSLPVAPAHIPPSPATSPAAVAQRIAASVLRVSGAAARDTAVPEIRAASYFLWGEREGLLLAKNVNEALPIASITKLITALVFRDEFPDDAIITISSSSVSLEGGLTALKEGSILTKQEALAFLLISSSNAVAHSIAESFGAEDFLRKMGEKAAEFGMARAHFVDSSGLDSGNTASAMDLLALGRALAARAPEILVLSRMPALAMETAAGENYQLRNTNILLNTLGGVITGGKTGYTDAAGGCLLLIFERNGVSYIALVLGSSDRFGEMQKLINYSPGNNI